ncbi:MAG: alpha/beta hydrolase [Niveispirillum sp.]|nr:alpha/beta hydrolase [Niveispirillum sp.]
MSMSIAEATAATPRGLIHYADAGEGPAVLSLHGAMGGTDQGMILARVTGADAGRVIAPARPGYPGTPLSSGVTPEAQADLYAALLDHLCLDRVTVIAVSGGGASALMFALRHPGRCRGLVLVSTCAGPQPMPTPGGFRLFGLLARWPAFAGWMKGRALRNPDRISSRSIPDLKHQGALRADPVAMPLYRDLRVGMFDRLAERLPGTENDIRTTRSQSFALEEIGVPTLVVHGTHDPLLPYERHGAELVRRIQGAEMLTVCEGGHAAIFTHRALIVPRVAGFLAAL